MSQVKSLGGKNKLCSYLINQSSFGIIGCLGMYHCTILSSLFLTLGARCQSYCIQKEKEEKLSLIKGTPSGNFILFYFPVFTLLKIKAEVLNINLLWIMFSSLSIVIIFRN
jgi:hypothetical protein